MGLLPLSLPKPSVGWEERLRLSHSAVLAWSLALVPGRGQPLQSQPHAAPWVEGTCFAAHLELIFALEVVQEVLVVGVAHLAEQREKAGHILTLEKPERHLAQTITRDNPNPEGRTEGRV